MRNLIFFIILFLQLPSIAQTIIDIDGNHYKTIKIGNETWMSQNLNVSHFRNGDTIPEVTDMKGWQNAWRNKTPAWCYPQNLQKFGPSYGKLYNWYAVIDPRGLAPANCKIPTASEWMNLINFFGDSGFNGYKIKNTGFDYPKTGYKDILNGFRGHDEFNSWWTCDVSDETSAWHILLGDNFGPILMPKGGIKGNGIAVRCLLLK
jgi:uncharacterized protein (TIGR02145 family)